MVMIFDTISWFLSLYGGPKSTSESDRITKVLMACRKAWSLDPALRMNYESLVRKFLSQKLIPVVKLYDRPQIHFI